MISYQHPRGYGSLLYPEKDKAFSSSLHNCKIVGFHVRNFVTTILHTRVSSTVRDTQVIVVDGTEPEITCVGCD